MEQQFVKKWYDINRYDKKSIFVLQILKIH